MGRLVSVHSGKIAPMEANAKKRSAIKKTPLQGPVTVTLEGIVGDQVADLRYHGGPFKALCCYSSEFYALWAEQFSAAMPLGSFGENLALEGLLDADVCIGDVYTINDAKVQVAGPRAPCGTLVTHWGVPGFHTATKKQRKTGFYMRVLQPGTIQAGDAVTLSERPEPEWSLPRYWDAVDQKPDATRDQIEYLMKLPFLDPDWEPYFLKALAKL